MPRTVKTTRPIKKQRSKKTLLTKAKGLVVTLGKKVVPTMVIFKSYKNSKSLYIGLIIAAIFLLALYKKNLFLAATVNGSPINNIELLSRLNSEYRTQTINQMINEKIVLDQAHKQNVFVSDTDINDRIAQLEKSVGGAQALDSLLTQQGQSRASLINQLRIQITVEKMFDKQAPVSAEEVNQFITENKDTLQATDSAGQTKEATDILKQQKIAKLFQTSFQTWKQQAKVVIY